MAAGILVTRVLGYLRERVFAYYFGNVTPAADAFRAALRIPNAIRNLLGEGTLSASFIPVYARLVERKDTAARALAGATLGLLLAVTGVLAVVGIALAPAITTLIAKGFDAPRRELTIALVRVLFPMTGLMVVSAWCLGILNTHRQFFLPYAAPALWNVAGIAAMVGASSWLAGRGLEPAVQVHRLALALAWGTVAGALLQIAVQLPECWRLVGGIRLRVSLVPEGVRSVIAAWVPLLLGAGVAQLSGFVDTVLGSFTGPGGVSALGYAQLVQVLPISLFGVSVAAVSLPELSRDAGGEAPNEVLRARIAVAFRRISFFILPASFAFTALGPVLIGALFQTGRFTAEDTAVVGGVLSAYGVGLLGQATVKLFASGFYALRDTRTPVKIASASLALSAALAVVLMRIYGPAGIAFGSSLGSTVNVIFHLRDLDRRIGSVLGRLEWRALGQSVAGALLATGAGVLALRLVARAAPIPQALVATVIFLASYAVVTIALRHPDATRLWKFVS
ncbi:MAG TPA: murein biosynthesis integral membrane protein MurJ [Gemmatimonadales bacterium]|nr:murein biosynthesis integral membrane protein MurJ [Gemmatimonadales bacterium]